MPAHVAKIPPENERIGSNILFLSMRREIVVDSPPGIARPLHPERSSGFLTSKTADEFYSNPVKFFEYKEKENFSIEYLNRNSHKLHNFYNNKYKQYLKNIETR